MASPSRLAITPDDPDWAVIFGSAATDLDALTKFRDYRRSVGLLPTKPIDDRNFQ